MLWRATTSRKVNVYATSSTVDAITSHVILNYNKGVENMYKRDKHYNEKISRADLEKELRHTINGSYFCSDDVEANRLVSFIEDK